MSIKLVLARCSFDGVPETLPRDQHFDSSVLLLERGRIVVWKEEICQSQGKGRTEQGELSPSRFKIALTVDC